jgi:hypothetical protein
VIGAASGRSGLSVISVNKGFINGFSAVGFVYFFICEITFGVVNVSTRSRVVGNTFENMRVTTKTIGIANKYDVLLVPINKRTEKYRVNLTTEFRALGTSISLVGTNFCHVSLENRMDGS